MSIFKTKDKIELYCEYNYETTASILREKETNGCGPGGWKFDLVPDSIWGCPITDACNIHDWMYHFGKVLEDKDRADRIFRNNMIRLINARTTNWFAKKLLLGRRLRMAEIYYEVVSHFGGPAFWNGKEGQPK
ncbi:MAG TPA: hypothetical protein VI911_10925 [Patescibacteria group bacterium]|nr:hypothetical protein [Patescibacteria group bacterium]